MAIGTGALAAELAREVEEEMAPYSPKDLAEDWEFKIIRSPWAIFKDPERLKVVIDEEKQGGWILVEKFDDSRLRLKRPVGAKVVQGDFADGYDPYRTTIHGSLGSRGCAIPLAVFVVVVCALILFFFLFLAAR